VQEIIALKEHEESYIALSEDDASVLAERLPDQLTLKATTDQGQYLAKPTSHVGVVRLPSGRAIVIEPKVRIETLFALLAAVYDPQKEIIREEPHPYGSVAALFEFVVAMFTRHVEELIARGLLRAYTPLSQELPMVRGRLLIAETIRHRPGLYDRHRCAFTHFSCDIPENRILRWTAYCLQSGDYREPQLWSRIRSIQHALRGATLDVEARRLFPLLTFHRLNDPYRPALAMARLLLDHLTFSGSAGSEPFLAYLVDMNWLFEKYVGALVSRAAPAWQARASEQHAHALDAHRGASVRPDVIVHRRGSPELVIDAKYKLDPHQSDVYQVIAYCHALDVDQGVLVHPATERITHRTLRILGPGGFSVHYLALELSGGAESLEAHSAQLTSQIAALLPGAMP